MAAGRLTTQGKLGEATLAIQRALSSGSQACAHTNASWPGGAAAAVVDSPIVLEGLVREREGAPGAAADAGAATAERVSIPGRFVDSSFTGATGTRAFKLYSPAGFE